VAQEVQDHKISIEILYNNQIYCLRMGFKIRILINKILYRLATKIKVKLLIKRNKFITKLWQMQESIQTKFFISKMFQILKIDLPNKIIYFRFSLTKIKFQDRKFIKTI
jgi:hypothetical protein